MSLLTSLDGLFWLAVTLGILICLQRRLHREIQVVLLIVTRHSGLTQILFAVLFLPGVFLHELSHLLMAKLLGVPTGRFSLLPKAQEDGKLRLGYVETASEGVIKDAFIGLAPLVTGILFVAYAAIYRMHLLPLWDMLRAGQLTLFWLGVTLLPKAAGDFWLWFYLTIVVSSTMMPSASDRRAWLPVLLTLAGLLGIVLLAGAGEWLILHLAPPLNTFLRALALIFGLSAAVHALLVVPFLLLHKILARIFRVRVV